MKKYIVTRDVIYQETIEVEAENKEDAIQKAIEEQINPDNLEFLDLDRYFVTDLEN
jgi:hypothetical protein